MDTNQRVDYFFNQLETIISDPVTKQMDKIQALKVYGSLLPTQNKSEVTIKQEVATLDTSILSNDEKINLISMLEKLDVDEK